MRINIKPGVVLTVAALMSLPVAAQATTHNSGTRTVTVDYADLDLNSKSGAKKLEQRVKSAARKVCGPAPSRNLLDIMDYRQCYKGAISNGKKAIVTVIASAKAGKNLAQNKTIEVGN